MTMGIIASAADRRLLDDRHGTRAMAWVMAIMLFLTVLAAALGLATLGVAAVLDRQLAGRLTVQVVAPAESVRTREAAAALAALKRLPEVRRAVAVDPAHLAEMLRPWLGTDGADPDLPIPAMMDVDLTQASAATLARVQAVVRAAAPSARVDRQESWLGPVRSVMRMLSGMAGGLVLLMAGATAAVVILAARAGLDTHSDTIAVLHMLGSTDVQVARLFQRRIGLDTLLGGLVGMAAAIGVVLLVGVQLDALGSDLVTGLQLGVRDWVILGCLPIAFAILATLAARLAVLAALRRVL
ncbi:cell division protein FtsX [Sphingomonas echinoides]|uniref:cell division protein FtsX n=1 Tax=Sphingomonas echinoides TaxID=59803 RepID=UPI002412EE05|nr:permease [Sphingomonas echinoides]